MLDSELSVVSSEFALTIHYFLFTVPLLFVQFYNYFFQYVKELLIASVTG